VQGSRVRPYQVRIGVLPLTKPQWLRVCEKLASQALFRAKLLAGEMPHEIEEVFSECGTPLFPDRVGDLDMSCSCPDWEVPCKHLAAVCYVLAEAFDADPFAVLAWRGKPKEDLLGVIRRGRGVSPGGHATAGGGGGPGGAGLAADERFWVAGVSAARLRALSAGAGAAAAPDLLLRMFEPPPVQVRGKDLRDVLAPAYQRLALPPDGSV
jgi:hypothetical protein